MKIEDGHFTKEKSLALIPLLEAIVQGKTIQVKCDDTYVDMNTPYLNAELDLYRIKPEAKTMKYRLYWWKVNPCEGITLQPETVIEENYSHIPFFEDSIYFGGWISDWIEIEVPEIK